MDNMDNWQETLQEPRKPPKDERAYARFYRRAVADMDKKDAEGNPVPNAVLVKTYIEIQTPGDKNNIVNRPARVTPGDSEDLSRFPNQWAAFQANKDQAAATGTLLSVWGALPDDRAEVYRFRRVKTVEALAALGDSGIQALTADLGTAVRDDIKAAKQFLEAKSDSGGVMLQMRTQSEEKDAQISALRQSIEVLSKRLDAKEGKAAEPKRRGRPPKSQPVDLA